MSFIRPFPTINCLNGYQIFIKKTTQFQKPITSKIIIAKMHVCQTPQQNENKKSHLDGRGLNYSLQFLVIRAIIHIQEYLYLRMFVIIEWIITIVIVNSFKIFLRKWKVRPILKFPTFSRNPLRVTSPGTISISFFAPGSNWTVREVITFLFQENNMEFIHIPVLN